jgi:fructokinase
MARDHLARTSQPLAAEFIITAARKGNVAAAATLDRYISRLGRGLAMICNTLDPDVFVFGGGLSNVRELYERLPAAIAPYVFSDGWEAKLASAMWGDSSGVRGAARLWR